MKRALIFVIFSLIFLSMFAGACSSVPATPSNQTTVQPPSTTTSAPSPTPAKTTSVPTQSSAPTTTPPPDITPPPPITGLVAHNAYDGKINLWWNGAKKIDFGSYNIYVSKTEITDVTGLEPVQRISDIVKCNSQVSGLENNTTYYFAVSVTGEKGNENKQVTSVSAAPLSMPAGTTDPDFEVAVYLPEEAWAGTTLLPDNHNEAAPRIIEVNMLGEIVWEYRLPENLKQYTNPGFDVELLENNNVLFVLPRKGVYEIDREGTVVWSHLDAKISHDADRLPNGNTLYVYGSGDQKADAQVKEVDPVGNIVWSWYAKDYFDRAPYAAIFDEGWTHTNAVSRLENGNTLISPRNFDLLVEVGPDGGVVNIYGEGIFFGQHDPAVLASGHILLANHDTPHMALEYDPVTGEVVWRSPPFERGDTPVRDANRLPNGNTLITCSTKIIEITPDGRPVWEFRLKGITFTGVEAAGLGFYKAERID